MSKDTELLSDPDFQDLLSTRSRWRWGLSGGLIGVYFAYALGGLYFAEAYARPLGNSSVPAGIVAGLLLIVLSVFLSLAYIRVVNRLKTFAPADESAE